MIEMIKENFSFKKQLMKLSKSELIKKYKGAALGPAWAIINPTVTIFVYWFAFVVGLRGGKPVTYQGGERTFFQFLVVGNLPWFFMRDAILNGAKCFRDNRAFITKMPFPVSAIPTYTLLADLYANLGLTVVVYVLMLCLGVKPSIYNLQLLFYIPMMYLMFLFLSWATAPLCAISRDFHNIIKAVSQALFWISGIVYNPHGIESPILRKIILANPITYFANGFRNALLYETWFWETRFETCCMFAWMVVFAIVGVYTYRRMRKIIPDVL